MKDLTYGIRTYRELFENKTYEEVYELEKSTYEGKQLSEIAFLINEKIKISSTFSFYFIEKCSLKYVSSFRKFIEQYEYEVDSLISNSNGYYYDLEKMRKLINITILLDLVMGIDVSYISGLYDMLSTETMDKIANGIKKNFILFFDYKNINELLNGGYRS